MKNLLIYGFVLFGLTGCNLYGGIDSPSGDAQLISAARAAFDQGNLSQALSLYQQVSASNNDIKISEEAEIVFNQAGATIQNFAAAFGNGKGIDMGSAISNFTVAMSPFRGATNRITVFNAFQTYKNIQNSDLRAFVQFLGGMTMSGLVLAEDMGTDTTYSKKDVCPPNGTGACAAGVLLAGPNVSGSGSMTNAALSDFNAASATLSMFNAAMIDVSNSVTAMGASGAFGSSASTFAAALTANNPNTFGATGALPAYRAEMIQVNIGL